MLQAQGQASKDMWEADRLSKQLQSLTEGNAFARSYVADLSEIRNAAFAQKNRDPPARPVSKAARSQLSWPSGSVWEHGRLQDGPQSYAGLKQCLGDLEGLWAQILSGGINLGPLITSEDKDRINKHLDVLSRRLARPGIEENSKVLETSWILMRSVRSEMIGMKT
eukprot:TRINITY_DN10467_c0_g4_i1.p1 TRINITY_DN10467_c0_g4~~TRINITY_DN10467_c0_g4_i1.p1  ORF type:complete len:166 (-),score=24.11 TRINITY_DN10467_c0_g4_i1:406-903(-)